MIIKMLIENTSCSPEFDSEHGLSIYIETDHHKILFDTGASKGFLNNSRKMNVPISDVDVAIISHGHYDHGGGLTAFLKENSKATVYVREDAFGDYYSISSGNQNKYIGLNKSILNHPQIKVTQGHTVIDNELELFSQVKGSLYQPSGNKTLLMRIDEDLAEDTFQHEQNLVVREKDKTILIAGCAHMGIANIMEHYYRLSGSYPTYVVGGFHLYNRSKDKDESPEQIYALGEYLKSKATVYYTCHCTGIRPYNLLKEQLGKQINYLSTGSEITL